jgi:hypothetical protein
MFPRLRLLPAAAVLAAATPACAQSGTDFFSGETITIAGDARIIGVDGETSWLDGGLGKTRFDPGSARGDFRVRPVAVEADLVWKPRFTWSLSGTVAVSAQQGQEHALDLTEAVLSFKPMLPGPAKLVVRAGAYWPAISLEHSGPEWAVTETITPSAINSWIGDEIKVGGAEATVTAPLGSHRVAATLGLFGFNDTSGTLLALRGWALHDQKATLFGHQPLPPLDDFLQTVQAPETRPFIEIDNRIGWYASLGWSPADAFELQAFHYDNRGDPDAVTDSLQWGWRTRFDNLGAVVHQGPLTLKAQAMAGRTEMGFPDPVRIWFDTHFRAAYLLETWSFARGSVSARLDAFDTDSRGSAAGPSYSEEGWALTFAGRRALGPHLSVLAEFLHVDSSKRDRLRLGLPARQRQNQAQLALRVRL